jgi:hypothetical protein
MIEIPMSTEKPPAPLRCFDCGAENDPGASECWLCHRRDWRGLYAGDEPQSLDTRQILEQLHRERLVESAGRIAWVTLGLVLIGTTIVVPGLGIGLAILALFLIVPVRGAWRVTKGMSPLLRFFATLMLSVVFFILLILAVFIALYLICMAAGGFFH